jgi:uncharacterized protein
MFYHYDPIYLVLVVIGLIISFGATALVKLQFARGKRVAVARGLTGREVAQAILDDANITDVSIVEHQGFLSDHYNPMSKTLALSPEVYGGRSAASVGVAAHEVGHAIQHAQGYVPLWLRSVLVPVANIGSMIGPILIMIGIAISAGAQASGQPSTLAMVGVIIFAAATLFTLITVPVEFNASSRAKDRLLALGITQPGAEANAVRGVLLAAGLTYVAAAIVSLMQLIYWAWRAGLIGGRRD